MARSTLSGFAPSCGMSPVNGDDGGQFGSGLVSFTDRPASSLSDSMFRLLFGSRLSFSAESSSSLGSTFKNGFSNGFVSAAPAAGSLTRNGLSDCSLLRAIGSGSARLARLDSSLDRLIG